MQENITKKLVINFDADCVQREIYHHIMCLLQQQEDVYSRPIVVLCIGSDRYIGDALGPLVGSFLMERADYIVYGSLDNPVHAGNLVEIIHAIEQQYYQPIIIAVDACLGSSDEIGNIEIWEGSLEAGIAVGTRLPCVGHISIIGVVNASRRIGYLDLQNTPLAVVVKLSKYISRALRDAIHIIQTHHEI